MAASSTAPALMTAGRLTVIGASVAGTALDASGRVVTAGGRVPAMITDQGRFELAA